MNDSHVYAAHPLLLCLEFVNKQNEQWPIGEMELRSNFFFFFLLSHLIFRCLIDTHFVYYLWRL